MDIRDFKLPARSLNICGHRLLILHYYYFKNYNN